MYVVFDAAMVVSLALAGRLRTGVRARVAGTGDGGATTLEMVVIALGLLLAAGVAIAAITAAVKTRTAQIK